MRGIKLITAILTLIVAVAGIALSAATGILAFGMTGGIADQINDIIGGTLSDIFGDGANTLMILFCAFAGVSVLLLILGIRFCSRKLTRFTGFILWNIYMAITVGLLYLGFPKINWIYLGAAIFTGVMSILIAFYFATMKVGQVQDKPKREKKQKQPKQEQSQPEPQPPQEQQPAPQPQPQPQQQAPQQTPAQPATPSPATEKIAVTVDSPNLASKVIAENLGYATSMQGSDVIVGTGTESAQKIADLLHRNGIKVAKMRRV